MDTCDACKTTWNVGSNLFSQWRYESEEIWLKKRRVAFSYKEVEPIYKEVELINPEYTNVEPGEYTDDVPF